MGGRCVPAGDGPSQGEGDPLSDRDPGLSRGRVAGGVAVLPRRRAPDRVAGGPRSDATLRSFHLPRPEPPSRAPRPGSAPRVPTSWKRRLTGSTRPPERVISPAADSWRGTWSGAMPTTSGPRPSMPCRRSTRARPPWQGDSNPASWSRDRPLLGVPGLPAPGRLPRVRPARKTARPPTPIRATARRSRRYRVPSEARRPPGRHAPRRMP